MAKFFDMFSLLSRRKETKTRELSPAVKFREDLVTGVVEPMLNYFHENYDLYTALLLVLDLNEDQLAVLQAVPESENINYESLPVADTIFQWVLKNQKTLHLPKLSADFDGVPYYLKREEIKSLAAHPIFISDRIQALLCVDSMHSGGIPADLLDLMRISANAIAFALERYLEMEEARKQALIFDRFYQVSRELNSTIITRELYDITVKSAQTVTKCEICLLLSYLPDRGCHIVAAAGKNTADLEGQEIKTDEGLVVWSSVRGHSLRIPDLRERQRQDPLVPSTFSLGDPVSVYTFPMTSSNEYLGVIMTASYTPVYLGANELPVMEVLANQAATSISKANIHHKASLMAIRDELTGLYNHRHFQYTLEKEIERARRYQYRVSLLLMDLDHFKQVNDNYGHPAGDYVLRETATRIQETLRKVDFLARYGGEELVAILFNTEAQEAWNLAERARRSIADSAYQYGNLQIPVSISIGLATFPDNAQYKALLIKRADEALYRAKESGRNRVEIAQGRY